MTRFDYVSTPDTRANLGLIVLQSDETIEQDFRRLLPDGVNFYVSRVPSAPDVSPETLREMEQHIPGAAGLFPRSICFDVVGYGCTSGTSQIGRDRVATLVRDGTSARAVTEPVSALVAACEHLGLKRLAFLSPYVETVSRHLRDILDVQGIATPLFGSFNEAQEAKVVRISRGSIVEAGRRVVAGGAVDGLFLSCTNLRTLDAICDLEAQTGLTVLSSNQVLAWHMARLAGHGCAPGAPGRLFAEPPQNDPGVAAQGLAR